MVLRGRCVSAWTRVAIDQAWRHTRTGQGELDIADWDHSLSGRPVLNSAQECSKAGLGSIARRVHGLEFPEFRRGWMPGHWSQLGGMHGRGRRVCAWTATGGCSARGEGRANAVISARAEKAGV